jgi:hypothetical protein
MQNATDIVSYYNSHPPFEVSDPVKYNEVLTEAIEQTLRELSEIDPVLHETTYTTPSSSDNYVIVDIFDTLDTEDRMNKNFMSYVILT